MFLILKLTRNAQLWSAITFLGQTRLVSAGARRGVRRCVADDVQLFHLTLGTDGCIGQTSLDFILISPLSIPFVQLTYCYGCTRRMSRVDGSITLYFGCKFTERINYLQLVSKRLKAINLFQFTETINQFWAQIWVNEKKINPKII